MDILSTIDYNIKNFSELINKKKIYESDIERREKEVEQYAKRLKFLKCTKELYLNAVDLMYQESIGVLQETLNSAMQYVMKDKDYSVKLELEDKRGAKTLNLALIDNEKGFEVLDFPCDQFGHQAPGTDDEINEFCLGMPRYKRPKKIIFAEIPRNPTGKIEKPKLRAIYCGERLVEAESKG